MRRDIAKNLSVPRRKLQDQCGVALITTLLLLLLVTGMTIAMVLAVNSDMLINGYYRNFRGSFYAADSGLNIVRQDLYNQLSGQIPATLTAGTPPLPTTADATVRTYLNSKYTGNYIAATGTGAAASSWRESYTIDTVGSTSTDSSYFYLDGCSTTPSGYACTAPISANVTRLTYTYRYALTAHGRSKGNENAVATDKGTLTINVDIQPAGGVKTAFSAWGMFIDKNDICDGQLVAGTISGPAFTNGSWTFGTGSYIFTDSFGQAGSQMGYQFGSGTCKKSSATQCKGPSSSNNCSSGNTTIKPDFRAGAKLGQDEVPLPDNDYNQKLAVVDGKGDADGLSDSDIQNQMHQSLKKRDGTAYTSSANSGVFTPYSTNSTVCGALMPPLQPPCVTGGGIYVKDNNSVDTNVKLSIPTGTGASTTTQIYTITQGGTQTDIKVDIGANGGVGTTTITEGGNTVVLNGVPTQRDSNGYPIANPKSPANTAQGAATMLYVDGDISSLSGPATTANDHKPAIQDGTALTVTAAGNIAITGDIEYKTKPVTTTDNQIVNGTCCNGKPLDTLIPGNDNGQVLGIFTNKGDIQLKSSYGSNKNLEIDGSIATLGKNCGDCALVNPGNSINTLTIIGGRIQNTIDNINSSVRNVMFDRRFSVGGFAPPWFPSTSISQPGLFQPTTTATFQRTQWQNRTPYY